MSYSFGCIKKCFTHKKKTRVEILNTANTNQTNYDYSSAKGDIWATVVPKTFQTAQTPLSWQSSNVTAFSMPPPKRSAPRKEGNVKHTKDMPVDSLDAMNPFAVPSPQSVNSTVSISPTMSADISQMSSCDTAASSIGLNTVTNSDFSLETMAIDFNNLPKADPGLETIPIDFNSSPKVNPPLETMSIDFNNIRKADPAKETMAIDLNNLPKSDPTMETMSIDFNNLPKANPAMETMSIDFNNLPTANPAMETMSIDLNNLPKSDPTMETMSIDFNNLPKANPAMETMSIDFNNLPKANPAMETMSIDFNNLPTANPAMETMSIDFNNLPKSDPTMETMSIDFNNLPKANPATETMSIDFNSLPTVDPAMETMSIDFNNLPKANPAMETMSIDFNSLPTSDPAMETMSIDFNGLSKDDYTNGTVSIVPDTMTIDFNQMPTASKMPESETMAVNLNDILPGSTGVENSREEADEQDVIDETLPEDDAYEEGLASEALNIIRQSKIAIVYEDEDKDEIEKKIKEEFPIIKKVNSVKVDRETRKRLQEVLLRNEWPLAFVKGDVVGGLNELRALSETGVLTEWLKKHDYDLIVIGGGSGGLAAAKEASRLGKKVACLDFVKPSPQGTTWGLGGTCVNVGCIPKKLMHQASLLGHSIKDARAFGWQIPEGQITHSWKNLKDGVQDHISSLNWGYRVQLREKMVNYVNAYGSFSGPFEISATNKKGKVEKLTADRFLVATGLRPRFPEIPGAQENCITSDDLFALSYPPGKTLCVGASYVSLECAGFLKGIGFDVTVMVRSILLRGFDQDIAERIKAHMVEYGIRFERGIPSKIEEITPKTKQEAGLLRVYWNTKNEEGEEIESHEDYNTVVMAIGREAAIDDVKLETLGVTRSRNGKVLGRREQSLGCPYVYAIGDVLENTPELTPVAIQAGRVLMRRLYLGSDELTEYDQIPTTVFTPLEYGCCGLSEEESYDKYGKDNIVVYHAVFNPLEYTIPERMDKDHCYCKLICVKNERDRVVGYHILTPSAGEVTQGFAIALKLGGRKRDFDRLIGIHPTIAENFTTLTLIKKEGEELKASGC